MRISALSISTLLLFTVLTSSVKKATMLPLKVSPDKHFLVKENGKPFFWLGDTGWNLFFKLNRDEAKKYLSDRRQKKFTVIQAHLLGWKISDTNAYGQTPFTDDAFSHPNEAYWQHVDFILEVAAAQGLYMAVLPAWASTYTEIKKSNDGESSLILPLSKDSAAAYEYARFLGRRYKKMKHLIWILGGDVWGRNDAIYDALARGLTETYANGDPDKILISFHPQGGTWRPPATSTSEFYNDKPWLDFHMIQSGHRIGNKNYERINKDYHLSPTRPTVESEPCYEMHPILHDFKNGAFNAWHIRNRAYSALLAGSFGFTYGANGIWQMDKPGRIDKQTHFNYYWYQALDYEGATQLQYASAIFTSKTFVSTSRIPDSSLLVNADTSALHHVECSRASDDSYVLAYSSDGSTFNLDLRKLRTSSFNAWWYSPRDGRIYSSANNKLTKPVKIVTEKQVMQFDPPGLPAEGNDWLLILSVGSKNITADLNK